MKSLILGLEDTCDKSSTPAQELLWELNGHVLQWVVSPRAHVYRLDMHDMVVLLYLLCSTNWEALCEGHFVVGGKTRCNYKC